MEPNYQAKPKEAKAVNKPVNKRNNKSASINSSIPGRALSLCADKINHNDKWCNSSTTVVQQCCATATYIFPYVCARPLSSLRSTSLYSQRSRKTATVEFPKIHSHTEVLATQARKQVPNYALQRLHPGLIVDWQHKLFPIHSRAPDKTYARLQDKPTCCDLHPALR